MQYEQQRMGVIAGYASPISHAFLNWRYYFVVVVIVAFSVLAASLLQDLLVLSGAMYKLSKIWMLDIDVEKSVFTWISVLAFFFASQLLFQLGEGAIIQNSRFKWHWLFLAAVFLLLSLDEFTSIHEKISDVLAKHFVHTGVFYFAWAAPAGLFALLGLVLFVPFIRSFPQRLGVLLLLSAVIFLFGAVGMEMVGGAMAEAGGIDSLAYRLAATLEEGSELTGVLLFIYVLMTYREAGADLRN